MSDEQRNSLDLHLREKLQCSKHEAGTTMDDQHDANRRTEIEDLYAELDEAAKYVSEMHDDNRTKIKDLRAELDFAYKIITVMFALLALVMGPVLAVRSTFWLLRPLWTEPGADIPEKEHSFFCKCLKGHYWAAKFFDRPAVEALELEYKEAYRECPDDGSKQSKRRKLNKFQPENVSLQVDNSFALREAAMDASLDAARALVPAGLPAATHRSLALQMDTLDESVDAHIDEVMAEPDDIGTHRPSKQALMMGVFITNLRNKWEGSGDVQFEGTMDYGQWKNSIMMQ